MLDVAALVLAAGGSTRLGFPKQLVRFEGQTLLRRAVLAALGAGCSPVIVVVGEQRKAMRDETADLGVAIAQNIDWRRGIGSSIRTGMAALLARPGAPPAAVLIHLCDQPLVDAAALRRLVTARTDQQKDICMSAYDDPGGAVGPPVLAGAAFFDALLSLPDDQGAKSLWLGHPARCAAVPCPAGAIDIDTPSDVASLHHLPPR